MPPLHFIHLDRRTLQLQVAVRKQRTYLLENSPGSFVGNASLALNLLRGDFASCGTHEVHRIEPSLERSAGLLEDGSGQRIDVMAAELARICSAIAYTMVLGALVTLWAKRHALRKALFFDVFEASRICREFVIKVPNGVSQCFGNALFDFHA